MMKVKEVSALTGVSVRTLQFYDEIGLLKPSKVTDCGYRLYDDQALKILQQILFFRELDFPLKEIKAILQSPHYEQAAALQKQRELLKIKRDRLNNLLELLDKLMKGEPCMEFSVFTMDRYFRLLAEFKETYTDEIVEQLGSVENFDKMVAGLQLHKDEIADMAVKQYGNLENYTKTMEKSLQSFLSSGPAIPQSEVSGLIEKTEALTKRLTADLSKDAASAEIQAIVGELVSFTNECNKDIDMGEHYWHCLAENYLTSPVFIAVNDRKYGDGAAKFIGLALKAYFSD